MTRRELIVIGGVVVLLAIIGVLVVGWPITPPVPRGPQQAKFIGLTKGSMGPIYSALPPHFAAFIQQWLDSGTNAAVFSITNQRSYPVLLYPYAALETKGSTQKTFLVNAPTLYGIDLRPGQVAKVEVAALPSQDASRVRFYYSRDYQRFSTRSYERLRAFVARTNADFHIEPFYSDWFDE